MQLVKFTLHVPYFKMQEHVYMGIEFMSFSVHLLRLTCFSFYIIMYKIKKVSACFPTLHNLFFGKSEKKLLQHFTKEVEQNFMKEFSCEQKKKFQYNL